MCIGREMDALALVVDLAIDGDIAGERAAFEMAVFV
jgi:hypothetical protein